eukprot:CAMPEP_0194493166 /NCGR_PEP_ID=MMETSP0253-20130528/11469_1 /TAXON_ID=2966 /ORGANISM="Noctiluca scintillans" /LENGTH=396 /DNA_ID=CAMNT_0039334121 /DNA_START=1 /DNA_END=1191 /DNA_ORIENTATION=-
MAPVSSVGAVLAAWEACKPDGYSLDEERLNVLLPAIAAHVPSGSDSPQHASRLSELFRRSPAPGQSFIKMMTVYDGKVHFLHFWRAFGESARLVANTISFGRRRRNNMQESLSLELEELRDMVLYRPEMTIQTGTLGVSSSVLSNLVEIITIKSVVPAFWFAVAASLQAQPGAVLDLERLSVIMLSWLHDASAWRFTLPALKRLVKPAPLYDPASFNEHSDTTVYLHIYDVSKDHSIHWMNALFAHALSPLKFGGAFHAGVEVNGLEWSFGNTSTASSPGVECIWPKTHQHHRFRQTLELGRTTLPPEKIAAVIADVIEDYPGGSYCLLRRNCCHFAEDFCQRLGLKPIPGWVYRLARVGASADSFLTAMARGFSACSDPPHVYEEIETEMVSVHV